jgi:hypothetical protein
LVAGPGAERSEGGAPRSFALRSGEAIGAPWQPVAKRSPVPRRRRRCIGSSYPGSRGKEVPVDVLSYSTADGPKTQRETLTF